MARLTSLKPMLGTLAPVVGRLPGRVEYDRERDQRPWRKWYHTARWKARRLATFMRDGFTCQWAGCGRLEGDTSKLVADHRIPHRGNEQLFWDEDNLQTLCKPCHDGAKQRAEARGRA